MLHFILLLLMTVSLLAQEVKNGTITYVSRDQAFIDLGKKVGIQVGDTVSVLRQGEDLGTGLISQTSGSSSAVKPLAPDELSWRIGDEVRVVVYAPPPLDSQTKLEMVQDTSINPKSVFLDSAAFKPRASLNMDVEPDRFSPTVSGYVSTRISDRGGDVGGTRETSGSLYGQFKVLDLGIPHLYMNTYIRTQRSSRDTLTETKLYSLMLSYQNPSSRFSYLLGRVYHPQFSMLGTLDGLGISLRWKKSNLAFAAGKMPNISGISDQAGRSKFGLANETDHSWGRTKLGFIGEVASGEFSRNYLFLGSNAKFGSKVRMRGYGEFDLDLKDQSAYHALISLTRFRTSLNWRLWPSVLSSSRYSYQENVIDLVDTSRSEYERAARHALNTNLSIMFKSGLSLSVQASLRGDGSDRTIKMLGGSLHQRNFSKYDLSVSAGAMLMYSYLSEGGRTYASIRRDVLPWLNIEFYDEVFFYRILGEQDFRIRHLPEISLAARVPGLQRLRLRTRFEHEDTELLYRISLSASRQF